MNSTELTARRKADRAEMARQVAALAAGYGITATTCIYGPRHRAVDLSGPRGLGVTVNFDGSLGRAADTYVLSWHVALRSEARLHPGMFGRVNPSHGQKATDVAYGFDQLLRILRERFEVIRNGSAFAAEAEAPA